MLGNKKESCFTLESTVPYPCLFPGFVSYFIYIRCRIGGSVTRCMSYVYNFLRVPGSQDEICRGFSQYTSTPVWGKGRLCSGLVSSRVQPDTALSSETLPRKSELQHIQNWATDPLLTTQGHTVVIMVAGGRRLGYSLPGPRWWKTGNICWTVWMTPTQKQATGCSWCLKYKLGL